MSQADEHGAPEKARLLGQVFTPDAVADLMAAQCIHRPDATVLDPCVGKGALLLAAGRRLSALGASDWHRQLYGMELDLEAWATGRDGLADAAGVPAAQIEVELGDFLDCRLPIADCRLLGQAPAESCEPGSPLVTAGAGPSAIGNRQSPMLFDVALMNPPYTRQERVADERKLRGHAAGLSRRIGLYGHFWVHLAGFVRQGGWLGAITSATWLSVGFGRGLQAFLLEHFRIHFLIDFERDVFPDANVEACVAILEKQSGAAEAAARAETSVRFVRLGHGHDLQAALSRAVALGATGEGDGWRVRVVPQAELAAEPRWSRFFQPPLAGMGTGVSAAVGPAAVPLAALARIRRGITTGNNRVLLLEADAARAAGIEEVYLRDIVRSPREIQGLDTSEIAAPWKLLLPPGPGGAGSQAAAYLRARGVGGSAYLPAELPAPAPLLFGYAVRARKAFFRNSARLLAGDNFLEVSPVRAEEVDVLFALLNALPAALALETLGRGQGRGLLKIQRYELAALTLPDPGGLDPGLRRDLESLGEALRRSPADEGIRAALDAAACRAAGLDLEATRRAERELVACRLARKG